MEACRSRKNPSVWLVDQHGISVADACGRSPSFQGAGRTGVLANVRVQCRQCCAMLGCEGATTWRPE